MSRQSLALYRRLLLTLRDSPVPAPVQRKVKYNARQLWGLYSKVNDPEAIASLHGEARAAVRVLRWLKGLPQVRGRAGALWQGQITGRQAPRPHPCHPPSNRRHPPPLVLPCCRSILTSSSVTSLRQPSRSVA